MYMQVIVDCVVLYVLNVHAGDPRLRCSLRMGQQKQGGQIPPGKDSWKFTYSFLIYSLQDDVVIYGMTFYFSSQIHIY